MLTNGDQAELHALALELSDSIRSSVRNNAPEDYPPAYRKLPLVIRQFGG